MADTIIPVGNEVKGDITQCKIETAKTKVERAGALSLTQKESFKSYDVCTKKIVDQYTNNTVAGGGLLLIAIGLVALFVIASAFFSVDGGW